jgi:hypothetical protein
VNRLARRRARGAPALTVCWALHWAACGALISGIGGCRIYRDGDTRAPREAAEVATRQPPARVVVEGERQATPPTSPQAEAPPPAESVSLWVLNRSKTDLMTRSPEQPEEPEGGAVDAAPPALALVVLGLGPSHVCSEVFARRALGHLSEGRQPVEAVTLLLDDLRRWRWPNPVGTLRATVKSSAGDWGAVQCNQPGTCSSSLLMAAVRHHAILDGEHPRWGETSVGPPLSPAASSGDRATLCEAPPTAELRGPMGVVLRTGEPQFVAGLLDLQQPGDAGVIPGATQIGVSLATGPRGGVVLLSNCPRLPPNGAVADQIYAGLERGVLPEMQPDIDGCQLGHALVTAQSDSVIGADAYAWASAMAPIRVPVARSESSDSSPLPPRADAGVPGPTERLTVP